MNPSKYFSKPVIEKSHQKEKKRFFLSMKNSVFLQGLCEQTVVIHAWFIRVLEKYFLFCLQNNLWESTSYFQQRDWLPKWSLYSNISSVKLDKFQSSRPEGFFTKGVFRNFAKFIGKHLCQSLFFNKVAGLMLAT